MSAHKGVYPPVYKVVLVRERDGPRYALCRANAAARVFARFFAGFDREGFAVAFLDTRLKLIGVNLVSLGSLNQAVIAPREVFKPAILSNAANLIPGHPHLSGDTVGAQPQSCEPRLLLNQTCAWAKRIAQELGEFSGKADGAIEVRVVSAPRIDGEGGALDSMTGHKPVTQRQDGVLLPPEGGNGGERLQIADPLPGLHVLAKRVDDTPDGSSEGTGSPGYASHLGKTSNLLGLVVSKRAFCDPHHQGCPQAHRQRCDQGTAHGQGREPQPEHDLASQPARRYECQPVNPRPISEDHPLRHTTTIRMAANVCVCDADRIHPGEECLGIPGQGVRRVWATGQSVARHIGHQDSEALGEQGCRAAPGTVRIPHPVEEHQRLATSHFAPRYGGAVHSRLMRPSDHLHLLYIRS